MTGLYRPRQGRMIAGVCAGLARRFGVKPWTVRALALLSCLLPGPQFVVYLVLWIMLPNEERYLARTDARTDARAHH
ncbi:PspC domain-containing protein [Thermomonospora umbrina]|uniref:Phage shock protein C (PspC) family protein n=1 Tax=Thermomonospora umbrina TaxID=111806 RepID=A0A3D9SZV0_9ACTN|nr:PspC domain-containing protein [Thermomonospora umbrina]REE98525.1 phage shock protein C (PspC) family protein [Thermomonospora umbrina]